MISSVLHVKLNVGPRSGRRQEQIAANFYGLTLNFENVRPLQFGTLQLTC
jgi:hypothetical protein